MAVRYRSRATHKDAGRTVRFQRRQPSSCAVRRFCRSGGGDPFTVGRGGDDVPMDLALYSNDEVSREHLTLRRDPATGRFHILDKSVNGSWLDGTRLKKGVEEVMPDRAQIGVAEVLTLSFEARR